MTNSHQIQDKAPSTVTRDHQNQGNCPSTISLVSAAGPNEHQQAAGQAADEADGRGTPQSAAGSSRTPLASPGQSTARPARPEQQAASSITGRRQDAGPDVAALPDQATAGTAAEAQLAELQQQLAAAKQAQAELQDQVGQWGRRLAAICRALPAEQLHPSMAEVLEALFTGLQALPFTCHSAHGECLLAVSAALPLKETVAPPAASSCVS